jgi:pimeloyl-ACP methyl ester carboxylesterase
MEPPETRYAQTADGVQIAYQEWGGGAFDLVVGRDATVPVDMAWEDTKLRSLLERLGTFSRVMWFDARGTGSADAIYRGGVPNLEGFMDDHAAVMAASGSERAALVGCGSAGASAMLYAATYPDRVSALVLFNARARIFRGADYPCGIPPEETDLYIETVRADWATMAFVERLAPSMAANEVWCRWFMRACRLSSSPNNAGRFARVIAETNVHHLLGSIQAPTLILQRRGDRSTLV